MADIYVRSGAGGTPDGMTWGTAWLTVGAALSGITASDTVWVANDHAETFTTTTTWLFPATWGCRLLGANTNVTEPPTGIANKTATITTTTNAVNLLINGRVYTEGLQFNLGSGTAQCQMSLGNSNNLSHHIIARNIGIDFPSTAGTCRLNLGPTGTNASYSAFVRVYDLTLDHRPLSAAIGFRNGNNLINGLTVHADADAATTGFFEYSVTGRTAGTVLVENFDISGVPNTRALMNAEGICDIRATFRNGKIAAGAALIGSAITGLGSEVIIHNVDGGDTNDILAEYTFAGSVVTQKTTRILTGNNVSLLLTGNENTDFHNYAIAQLAPVFNSTVGSAVTATVEILRDSVTNLQDDEVWVEVQYLGASGFPLGSRISDRMAATLGTPDDQATSAASWDTTGMTNPNEQKLEVTFTPQEAGYVLATVHLGVNTSIYVDPVVVLS